MLILLSRIITLLFALNFYRALAGPVVLGNCCNKFSLSFAAKVNYTGFRNILEADRARAARLLQMGQGNVLQQRDHIVSATNGVVSYTASVGVGDPPTSYDLVIDTGSSNTWVGANKPYKRTKTSQDTGLQVRAGYGSGSFKGEEFKDTVTLTDELYIHEQGIGVATEARGFESVDGILGLGPTNLTIGTLSNTTQAVPTVTDELFKQGKIPHNLIGMRFSPSEEYDVSGQLDFGQVDYSGITGDLTFVPITKNQYDTNLLDNAADTTDFRHASVSSAWWGIDQAITYGGYSEPLVRSSGIVDTGTTLTLLNTGAYEKYRTATGATFDENTGLLVLDSTHYQNLKPLLFTIGGRDFVFTPNAQIWPRALNEQINGDPDKIYLVVGDLGDDGGNGLDFINGYTWLQRFYTVFDTSDHRLGFATTPYTDAMSN